MNNKIKKIAIIRENGKCIPEFNFLSNDILNSLNLKGVTKEEDDDDVCDYDFNYDVYERDAYGFEDVAKCEFVCLECYERYSLIEKNYDYALNNCYDITTYPITYQGKVSVDFTTTMKIKSKYYKSRDDALKELKVSATYLKYDVIFNIEYFSEQHCFLNYSYSMWNAEGILAHGK